MRYVMPLVLLMLGLAVSPAAAEMDDAARAARWADLQHAVFGDRLVGDGSDVLRIEAPARAEDAALVPVTITVGDAITGNIRSVYLIIDNNPSPLAGVFHFGPLADPHSLATRVRVDDYTDMHAVAELADGTLLVAKRFIKASGGCSAPASKDAALAMQRLGKMKLAVHGNPQMSEPVTAQLLVSHPNNTGMQMDQLTRQYIPADFVQRVKLTYADKVVLTVDTDISMSENPSITFTFVPRESGELRAEIEDSDQRHFSKSWTLGAATAASE